MRQLGEGGFGSVWEALGPGDQPVALKIPSSTEGRVLDRFRREVKVQSTLQHPNIVEVLDFDLSSTPPWVALPLARTSFDKSIEDAQTAPAAILQWMGDTVRGMIYAHGNHVLHRDLKPTNILIFEAPLGGPGEARIADFGLSRRFTRDPETFQTATGEAFGSRWFSAPELWNGFREADETADVFSLGRMFEYCFIRRTDFASAYPALSHCIRVATSSDPSARYHSVQQLQSEIGLLAGSSSSLMRPLDRARAAVQAAAADIADPQPLDALANMLVANEDDFSLLQGIFSRIPYEILDRLLEGHVGQLRTVLSAYVDSLETPLPVDAALRACNLLDHCLDVSDDLVIRATALLGLVRLAATYEMQPFSSVALHRIYSESSTAVLSRLAAESRRSEDAQRWLIEVPDQRLLPAVLMREAH